MHPADPRESQGTTGTHPEPEHPSLAAKAAAWGVLYAPLAEIVARKRAQQQGEEAQAA